jgi:ATP-dependent Clp protease protease subunit
VWITGEVEDAGMNNAAASLLFLNNQSEVEPIYLYINSPGGSVHSGEVLINTMRHIKAPVYTICVGMAASMGAVILSCGEKGHRYCMPYSDVMLHQVSSGTSGNIQDQRVSLEYSEILNKRLMTILAENCGKTYKQLIKDTNRDLWLTPEQAVNYGVVDAILEPGKM